MIFYRTDNGRDEIQLHAEADRKKIPTEIRSEIRDEKKSPIRLSYERGNRDLDPQLVWRGKEEQGWSDLVVQPGASTLSLNLGMGGRR